jgi:hypothetical protein
MRSGKTSTLIVWVCFAIVGLVLALLPAPPSQARMGGGHSYSGGSSSGSHSSGGGGGGSSWGGSSSGFSSHYYGGSSTSGTGLATDNGDKLTLLLEIIVLILVIYLLVRLLSNKSSSGTYSTFQSIPREELGASNTSLDDRLVALKARDENFSKVLFLDFAYLLYHKYYTYRGTSQFKLISPYLSKFINDQATGNVFYPQQRVHDIVIGKARILNTYARETGDTILIALESNLTVRYPTGEETRFLNREQWTFTRQQGLVSPPPAQMRTLSCPACGAPADFSDAGECPYCSTFILAGEKQWQVLKMSVLSSQPFKTEDPGGYVEESGTNLPTLKQADLDSQEQAFSSLHGVQDWNGFFSGFRAGVVQPYFMATYSAWSQGKWALARHLVSDRLYESNNFWMEEYARKGWQNRLENIAVENIIPTRIDLDKFYESITVRVFAACLDYTVDKQGKLIGGSSKKQRKFSEYWTFIRVSGVEKIVSEYNLKTCPACGAPADKIGQAGECGYCGSKISEGQFSWVLATISQDEAYEG